MGRFERIRSTLSRASGEVPADPPSLDAQPLDAQSLDTQSLDARPPEGEVPGPQATPPADPEEEFAWLDVDDPLGLPRIVGLRAGVYLITDSKGRRLGTIRGDFGIGFTVEYRQTSGWYESLDAAQVAVAAQAVGRPAGPVSAAS